MTERVAIVGSREHPDLEMVRAYVRSLPAGTVVVSGGAKGVDLAAEQAAVLLRAVTFFPDYRHAEVLVTYPGDAKRRAETHLVCCRGERDALLYRNTLIALACDRMVVFPDGSKGGCWDAAREAVRFRRPVEVRWANGEVQPFSASMQRRAAR